MSERRVICTGLNISGWRRFPVFPRYLFPHGGVDPSLPWRSMLQSSSMRDNNVLTVHDNMWSIQQFHPLLFRQYHPLLSFSILPYIFVFVWIYYEQQIKREVKRIHVYISGCRCNKESNWCSTVAVCLCWSRFYYRRIKKGEGHVKYITFSTMMQKETGKRLEMTSHRVTLRQMID